jgi:hypothetical protein
MALPLLTDPIDVFIDPATGDITPSGSINFTSGIAAVIQGATIRLKMFAGEWFLNLAQGVPYLERADGTVTRDQALLGQKFDAAKAIRAFRDQLLGSPERGIAGVPGILSLTQLDVSFDDPTRTLTITWQAKTAFGDTNLNTLTV